MENSDVVFSRFTVEDSCTYQPSKTKIVAPLKFLAFGKVPLISHTYIATYLSYIIKS